MKPTSTDVKFRLDGPAGPKLQTFCGTEKILAVNAFQMLWGNRTKSAGLVLGSGEAVSLM